MTDVATPGEQNTPPARDGEEAQELLSLLQRERADFLNFRRRAGQEREAEGDRARLDLLTGFLPLLDDLDRALAHVPDDLTEHPWTQGLLLSRRRLLDFLTRAGLEPFGTVGEPFDPALHEAVFFESRPDVASSRVEHVIRPGYQLGERVVRPAQVGVVGPVERDPSESATAPEASRDGR